MKLFSGKFLVVLSLFFVLAVSPVLAQRGLGQNPPGRAFDTPSATPTKSPNPGVVRSCEAKINSIQTRTTNLTKMATNMLDVFNSIAQRVMAFYTNKVLPSGNSVSNYDTLTADIQTKSTAVQTALSKAQGDVNSFSCQSSNPKGDINQFRVDMQAVKTALKNYRTSIVNLIVAVRRAAVKAEASASPSPTASPSPSAGPTATP